jgi:hypothetical protein
MIDVNTTSKKEELFSYVSWELQVSRLICASLFHFIFEEEIQTAMRLMKYVTLNADKFRFPYFGFLFAFI